MSEDITTLLRSKNPAERKRGIELLTRSNNPQTQSILQKFYQTETTPELKSYAKKAMSYLAAQQTKSKSTPQKQKTQPVTGKQKEKQEQVNRYLRNAEALMHEAHYMEARTAIKQAFQLNPELEHNPYAQQLAMDIYGETLEDALALIKSGRVVNTKRSTQTFEMPRLRVKPKNDNKDRRSTPNWIIGWRNILLINLPYTLLSILLLIAGFNEPIDGTAAPSLIASMTEVGFLRVAIEYLLNCFSLFMWIIVVDTCAVYAGGEGNWLLFSRNIMLAIYGVIFLTILFALLNQVGLVLVVLFLALTFGQITILTLTYKLGVIGGCFVTFASNVILTGISFGTAAVIGAILA